MGKEEKYVEMRDQLNKAIGKFFDLGKECGFTPDQVCPC
jgi:hypothetical protein